MIAGVRQFKLINALGREYDMTRPDALLHAPDGLGWGTERTVNRLGMTYIGINEKEIHQSPSGEMVFRTYEEYGRFLSFCQQGGLVLCYKPIETWYYCEALISIQKSEIQWKNNHLICPVQFTLLSYWYEKVVAQTAEPAEPAEPNYATVTGDPAVFNARYSYPIKELTVAIQGTQELNGYDKPWVGGAGKNLLNNVAVDRVINGVTFTVNNDGSITVNGTATALTEYFICNAAQLANLTDDTLYMFSGSPTNNDPTKWKLRVYIDQDYIDRGDGVIFRYRAARATKKVNIVIYAGTTVDNLTFYPMIETGSVKTSYEPYENIAPITAYNTVTITQTGNDETKTYDVELTGAGNVYKGTLNINTGVLTVEQVVETLDSGSNWYAFSTGTGNSSAVVQLSKTALYTDGNANYNGSISNISKEAQNYWAGARQNEVSTNDMAYAYNSSSLLRVHRTDVSAITDLATFKANMPTMQIAYRLATPQTYQLTPTQMSNLIGSNTIEADAGAVTVTYRTDARTEYKTYPYQYSYTYGDTAQNVFDITCDLPSYFKLTIFGEATNPSWRVVQNGSIVKSGKINATIGSSQKLVINTDPKATEIALYTLSNTRINNLYGYSDFATERIFALPQGESQVQVLTEDEQPPKVMIEVLKHV